MNSINKFKTGDIVIVINSDAEGHNGTLGRVKNFDESGGFYLVEVLNSTCESCMINMRDEGKSELYFSEDELKKVGEK